MPPSGVARPPAIAADALAGQAQTFLKSPELYAFLQANYAFYVAHDYARVLALLPDASHLPAYTPLAFSAQVLRGQALARRNDRNEAGFWRDLLHGANAPWQAETVQLGLALQQERHGHLADVFAPGSAVTDPDLRTILITHAAGPDLLRHLADGHAANADEAHLALYVLLYKALTRGDYARFLAVRPLLSGVPVPPPPKPEDYRVLAPTPTVFATGKTGDGYPCPALTATAGVLSANPADPHALLCLGDFLRLNGLDGVQDPDRRPDPEVLGGGANDYAGKPIGRGRYYATVIADPRAAAADKAYALYRSVMCFAPSGYDAGCQSDLSKPQRKALFLRLKHDYPTSPWAQKLKYYW